MADCQVYGLNPAGHHLTNILLHTASVGPAVPGPATNDRRAVAERICGRAVCVYIPLRVESVVWVSERKDTLSGLFFMLTLWSCTKYVGEFKVQGFKV